MGTIVFQISSLMIVYLTVYSDANQRKHQSSASLAFGHRGPVNSPHKWSVTRKMYPFDDIIMLGIFVFTSNIFYTYSEIGLGWSYLKHWNCQNLKNSIQCSVIFITVVLFLMLLLILISVISLLLMFTIISSNSNSRSSNSSGSDDNRLLYEMLNSLRSSDAYMRQ